MDFDLIASGTLKDGAKIHIGTLPDETVRDVEAEHLGFDGYFLYEEDDNGIEILAKVADLDAAFRLSNLWLLHTS